MTPDTSWQIPPSVRHWLAAIPKNAAVAVLLRHSVRDDLPPGDAGYALPITRAGVLLARELGELLGARLRTLHASPLPRCTQSAEAMRAGAGLDIPIHLDRLLGDPGAYVIDGKVAIQNWQEKGHEGVMNCLVNQDEALSGMAAPAVAARLLVRHMLAIAGNHPGLHVFVSHDSLVTATAARILDERLDVTHWPWFLEAAFFWQENGFVTAAYRDMSCRFSATALYRLEEPDVVDFARREIAQTVGCDCPARFFLAGGAFKTLLTGKPPRDLDLWSPSHHDREILLATLLRRGARLLAGTIYADRFDIGNRIVEVPKNVDSTTLEDQLARFDIALSAIGVEFAGDGNCRAVLHPLARASVARQEILLFKPLANWKYALATLERMRRYAIELGYCIPASEEAEIWQTFESQSPEMQQGMMTRHDRTGLKDHGVRQEASSRLRIA